MKISRTWLEEFVTLDRSVWPDERIATVLTDLGLEVEDFHNEAAALHRIVVGKVVTREAHPKADKLSVCTVDVGEPELRTICCGAANVAAGQTVPVALDGAVVPNGGFTIGKRMLRGVESNGMICSQTELNLGDHADGIWVLDISAEPGTPLAEALGITDTVFDVFNTPNRADCNSHLGVARELAAYITVQETDHESAVQVQTPASGRSASVPPTDLIAVVDTDRAPRYALQRIDGVRIGPSPEWMQKRLLAMGLRPRNIVVDVTNYVNMELGQPLHAFDAAKLRGGAITVKTATAGEAFTTLDGKERTLDATMLMICDQQGPVAIAGVMGGQNSEIDDSTTSIVLESAYFLPSSIRKTAKTLGLSTDASYRFERGIDVANVLVALQRATELIVELAGGSAGAVEEVYPHPVAPEPIRARYHRLRAINGIDVDNHTIRTMLTALGCAVTEHDADSCLVTPPTWRVDISEEIDLAEEVMRLHGINNVPAAEWGRLNMTGATLPDAVQAAGGRAQMARRAAVRTQLAARSYADCITAVLQSPEMARWGLPESASPVRLRNALGVEFSAMRSSLIPGLLALAGRNLRHGRSTLRLMEIGSVFASDATHPEGVQQTERLALVVVGHQPQHWSSAARALDVYDLLGDLQVLGSVQVDDRATPEALVWSENRAALVIGGSTVGWVGQVDPALAATEDISLPVYAAEVNLRTVPITQPRYTPVAPYPAIHRDVAMVLSEGTTAAEIVRSVRLAAGQLCTAAEVFDVYRNEQQLGAGNKSVAVALTFQSRERTLVEADVEASMQAVVAAAQAHLGATVRGM